MTDVDLTNAPVVNDAFNHARLVADVFPPVGSDFTVTIKGNWQTRELIEYKLEFK